jgi:hypothetical protein
MLTAEQRIDFDQLGVVRLTGVFSAADAARMREGLWQALAAQGLRRDDPATWRPVQATGFQALTRSGTFDALGGRVLASALDDAFGGSSWIRPRHWGAPLVTFPTGASPWSLPSRQWHIDFPARGAARPLAALRILAFLETVEARAGGTLVLAGSYHLVERLVASGAVAHGHSPDVRRALARRSAWLRDLWSDGDDADRIQRFMTDGALVDGIALRVLELSGAPGDAVLMHPWQLHAPGPNCGSAPRLMLSHSVVREYARHV